METSISIPIKVTARKKTGGHRCDFNNKNAVVQNKEFFIAEYSSLRSEIHQRLAQQMIICQIAITAAGAVAAYCFDKIEKAPSLPSVYVILTFPIVVLFISYGWAFNNTRICQLGFYLRKRELQVSKNLDFVGWENFVHSEDEKVVSHNKLSIKNFPGNWLDGFFGASRKVKPGTAILVGAQLLSIVLGLTLIIAYLNTLPIIKKDTSLTEAWLSFKPALPAVLFFIVDMFVFLLTRRIILDSNKEFEK